MAMSNNMHFQLMTGLKYLLPIIALGLLSVMFYMSQGAPEESIIPYSEKGLYDRVKGPQVSAPYFTGVTGAGDRLSLEFYVAWCRGRRRLDPGDRRPCNGGVDLLLTPGRTQ